MKTEPYLHSLPQPEPRFYRASREAAGIYIGLAFVFAFFLTIGAIDLSDGHEEVYFTVCALLFTLFLLTFFRREVSILVKNPVWLSFGPEGIGGYALKGTIPWNKVADLSTVRVEAADAGSFTDLLVQLQSTAGSQESSCTGKACRRRVELDLIAGTPPEQVYRELLKAFTYFSGVVPDRTAVSGATSVRSLGPFLIVASALIPAFALPFVHEMPLKLALAGLLLASGIALAIFYRKYGKIIRPGAPWLEFGPEGISGQPIDGSVLWSEVKDIGIVRQSGGPVSLVLFLFSGSPCIPRNTPPGEERIEIRLDGRLTESGILRLERDVLMAFARHAQAEAASSVPSRLEKLFSWPS